YFVDELKVHITYDFMAELCRCSFFSKEDFELFKYFIEAKGFNPKTKNDKNENLLFVTFKDYRFPPKKMEEKTFSVINYLVTKCKLDINEQNIYNETILYQLLSKDFYGNKKEEKNNYKIVDYLLKNFKIKLDTNTKLLLQKNFITFLKSVYKNIKE
nr:hypothetical protein [Endomicrobiaceae bacterium]